MKVKTVTIVLYKISEILAKRYKSFEGDNIIKVFLIMVGDLLYTNLKIKLKYAVQIKKVQLFRNIVMRGVECVFVDTRATAERRYRNHFFCLQLDESTDVCDVSHLLVFILIISNDGNIKEERLKTVTFYGKTRHEIIFKNWPSGNQCCRT
jgi:hypothetical protein